MDTKERAFLRGKAAVLKSCCFIGKDGLTDNAVTGVRDALTARELIKGTVQENCPLTAREVCEELCEMLGAQPVQCIGRKFVIYKRNKEIDAYGVK